MFSSSFWSKARRSFHQLPDRVRQCFVELLVERVDLSIELLTECANVFRVELLVERVDLFIKLLVERADLSIKLLVERVGIFPSRKLLVERVDLSIKASDRARQSFHRKLLIELRQSFHRACRISNT